MVMTFPVSLSAPSASQVTVAYATSNGTATAGSDYTAKTGTLTFAPGVTTGSVTVNVLGDTRDELDETLTLTLSNPVNALIGDGQATGTIVDDDPTPAINVNSPSATEANTTMTFTATLSAASNLVVTADYATVDGTATAGSDYTATTGSLSFAAGTTSRTFTVPILGDTLEEPNEAFTIGLSNLANAVAGTTGTGTIIDNDTASFAIANVTVTEGDGAAVEATFNVTLSIPASQAMTVNYATADQTATAGSDYTAASGTLTFPAGTTTLPVVVSVLGDLLDEANETFVVNLSGATGGATITDAQGLGTINDNDPLPTLAVDDVTVTEGNSGTVDAVFTVTLSPVSGRTVTVNRATGNSTAVAPGDYTALSSAALTFPAGTTTQQVTVQVNGDVQDEPDEVFFVNLSAAPNATIADAQGRGTITDDDLPTVSINNATVTEGNSGTANASFTVTLSSAQTNQVTVAYATADGTAVAPGDYTPTSGTLTFPAGTVTRPLPVPVVGDAIDESSETFTVTLSNPIGGVTLGTATGTGTITDNDTTTIAIGNGTVTEGDTVAVAATFNVALSCPNAQEVSVDWATADQTATAGSDYTGASGTLTFPPGTTTQPVLVSVLGDLLDEDSETFVVNLSGSSGPTITGPQAVGTITDNDARALSIDDLAVLEGNEGTVDAVFTVTLSAPSTRTVTVNRVTVNGTATTPADYTALNPATLTFLPGTTTQQVTVQVVGDVLDEQNESFVVALSGAVNATIADWQGVGTITDDDDAIVPTLSIDNVSASEGNAGSNSATFTVTLTPVAAQQVTVSYATANVTAVAPADYTAAAGSLTFAAGVATRTLVVPVLGDALDEDDETFRVVLSNPVGATLGTATGTGTITDDDASQMSISDATVTEGNSGTTTAALQVTLAAAAGRSVGVDFVNVAGGTATAGQDFEALAGTLIFAPGTTAKTITVNVFGDVSDEDDETVLVRLLNAPSVTFGDSQGQLTIVDDDTPALAVADTSLVEGNSGSSTMTFTVTLSPASTRQVTVVATTIGGTAAAGSDYTATSGTLTFAAGATQRTIGVPVLGDTVLEADEVVFLGLSSPVNATVSTAPGRGVIVNDEAGTVSGGELSHGVSRWDALTAGPGPAARENWYSLLQAPWTSHEVVVDEVAGRVSAGSGPIVELLDASGALKAPSVAVGTGTARSLRVVNATASVAGTDVVRVRSASCTTDCGADEGYRVRAYETTYSIPRFNNGGSQITVVVLQNTSSQTVNGTLLFWSPAGESLGTSAFSIAAHCALALNTGTLAGVAGKSGSITVANDGRYGDLVGKSIALEPSSGFSFDSPMSPRTR